MLKRNTGDRHILCCTEPCFRQKICLIFPDENWNIERNCESDSKSATTLVILSRMEKSRKKNNNCQRKQTQASAVINWQCCLFHELYSTFPSCACVIQLSDSVYADFSYWDTYLISLWKHRTPFVQFACIEQDVTDVFEVMLKTAVNKEDTNLI